MGPSESHQLLIFKIGEFCVVLEPNNEINSVCTNQNIS